MIRRTVVPGGQRTEFALESDLPVSVIGDFNAWDPHAGAMHLVGAEVPSTRSWTAQLAPGRYAFRYLDADGNFFDDDDADAYEPNGYGGFHGVLVVAEGASPEPSVTPTGRAAKLPAAKTSGAKTAGAKTSGAKAPGAKTSRAKTPGAKAAKPGIPSTTSTGGRPSAIHGGSMGPARADDLAIEAMFVRALAAHPYLTEASIHFAVVDQVAHLEGTVRSRLAKQALWDLAWSVRQIRDVHASVVIEEPADDSRPFVISHVSA